MVVNRSSSSTEEKASHKITDSGKVLAVEFVLFNLHLGLIEFMNTSEYCTIQYE